MTRILITGGAGFLGSHLCDRLVGARHDVLCVDNFFTGSKSNIAHLYGNPYFELQRHDVTFPLYVEVDRIYNLACPASPIHYQFDPVQTTIPKSRATGAGSIRSAYAVATMKGNAPRGQQLHRQGAAGCRHQHLRRRPADAQLLLCG